MGNGLVTGRTGEAAFLLLWQDPGEEEGEMLYNDLSCRWGKGSVTSSLLLLGKQEEKFLTAERENEIYRGLSASFPAEPDSGGPAQKSRRIPAPSRKDDIFYSASIENIVYLAYRQPAEG